jgi:hypothetical protein
VEILVQLLKRARGGGDVLEKEEKRDKTSFAEEGAEGIGSLQVPRGDLLGQLGQDKVTVLGV